MNRLARLVGWAFSIASPSTALTLHSPDASDDHYEAREFATDVLLDTPTY